MVIGRGSILLRWLLSGCAIASVGLSNCAAATSTTAAGRFEEPLNAEVRELLETHCLECHSPSTREGQLDLSTLAGIRAGGESGVAVVPGHPDESPLYLRLHAGQMPPEGETTPSAESIEALRQWIADGAAEIAVEATNIDASQIMPILWLRCVPCHGGRRAEANLDLRSIESLLKGGDSGPAAVAHDPAASRMIQRVHAAEMPPRRLLVSVSVKPMEATELKLLEAWIAAGLPPAAMTADVATTDPDPLVTNDDREFWSFRAPVALPSPLLNTRSDRRNPIDVWIESRLIESGLQLSPAADRATLIRRVTIDLTGLPPDPADVERFVADPDPRAYDKWLDRLLASPAYGERWARHWLDVAGYADSEGSQNEDRIRTEMWRYRDYVVRAFDSDKPYGRFLTEQLAGDELEPWQDLETISPEIADNLIATGFLRTAPDRTFAEITNFVPDRQELIADEIRILGSAVLGLTLHCARCHSHKFDPIPQRDYYRIAASLKDALDEHDWLRPDERRLSQVSTEERQHWVAEEERISLRLQTLERRLESAPNEAARAKIEASKQELEARRQPEPLIRALWSRGTPSPTYILRRGNYLLADREVGPGVLSVLTDGQTPFEVSAPWDNAPTTGRRLALAKWLTSPQHPLAHRVIVNRIWKHHFGKGIVTTLDDFGLAGARPTHPELLDWLAVELHRQQGSLKALHRLLLSSATYQQTSMISQAALVADPEGTLWSRMPIRRGEGEVLRDSMLEASGVLNRQRFGAPDPVDMRDDGLVTVRSNSQGERRSVYVLHRRTTLPTILESFDSPQMGPNCVERDESLVATQALHLTNDLRVHELAEAFAERVRKQAGEETEARLILVHRLAYGVTPTAEELSEGVSSIEAMADAWFAGNTELSSTEAADLALVNYCHAVFNSSRFLYVD